MWQEVKCVVPTLEGCLLQAGLAEEGVAKAVMGSKVAQLVEELDSRNGQLKESNTAISKLQGEHQQAREHLAASVAQAGSAWTRALLERVLLDIGHSVTTQQFHRIGAANMHKTQRTPTCPCILSDSLCVLQVHSLSDLHQQAQKYNAQLQEYNGKLQQEISSASQGLMKLQVRSLATFTVCHAYLIAACLTVSKGSA